MMRVDRNDICYNISQIGSGISKVFDICCDSGSSFPDYKHPFINWYSKDAEAIRMAEEQERGRRERNYDKLAGFRSGSVSGAFKIFSDEIDEIWSIYNNAIIPFENTDDDYSYEAFLLYNMWATPANRFEDDAEDFCNAIRGLCNAVVDLLDGVFSLVLYIIFGGLVFSGAVSLPDMVEERCRSVDAGLQAMLNNPVGTIEAMGQSMTDTYEEEGIAYATGYISLDIITEIVATKGLGSVKGVAKTADTVTDAAGVAKKVDTVTDVAGAVKKVDAATDTAGAVKNVEKLADMADTVTDAASTAKRVDVVTDTASAVKKVDTVTDAAGAVKKADTATDATDVVCKVDKVEETSDAARTADKAADAAKKTDGLEVKGGTSEVEPIPEPNPVVEGGSKTKLDYVTSNGLVLEATPNKTTVLGTYKSDTGAILDELGNVKSLDFGARDGGFNLLNTPDELYVSPNQFWNEYNKPWLDNAIARGDIFKIATEPTWDNLTRINMFTGKTELTGFGREYTYLLKHGYSFDNITKTMFK